MRRAVVTLAHPQHAGMLRALAFLDAAAARHGWELRYVLSGPLPPIEAGQLPRAQTTVLPGIGRWRRWPTRLGAPLTVVRLLQAARGADLLYSCTLSTFPYCLVVGRLARCPQVAHVYSSYASARPYRKHLLRWARDLVAPSADSLRLARQALGGFRTGSRARVVYNGMDVQRILDAAQAPLPAGLGPNGARRIGMVGNLDQRKNPELLVEAAARVCGALPDVRILLVGAFGDPGYERHVRTRITALGLDDAVTVTGFLPNPFAVVGTLDVLVHPARRDPFPLALLEAMALSRPIVATTVGGIPEMLVHGESGLLVPPDDVTALGDAIIALLRDDGWRASLGAAAHRRLTTEFTLDRFTSGMFAAFDDAVRAAAAET